MYVTLTALCKFFPLFSKESRVSHNGLAGAKFTRTQNCHYGAKKSAMALVDEPTSREPVISFDIITEWKTYHQLLLNKSKDSMMSQLKEVVSNVMMNPCSQTSTDTIAKISLSIPASTSSVGRSFSQMKLIKMR